MEENCLTFADTFLFLLSFSDRDNARSVLARIANTKYTRVIKVKMAWKVI